MYDKIIIGAGLYGLYSALRCGSRGEQVLVLEYDPAPFMRATYINQARVHMGYHYPRSLSTAIKSAGYYRRFHEDFGFAINGSFDQIYATSSQFSWTNAEQFQDFCRAVDIRCIPVSPDRYFTPGMCDGAFLTEEDTYDAHILRDYLVDQISGLDTVTLVYNARIDRIFADGKEYAIDYHTGDSDTQTCHSKNQTAYSENQTGGSKKHPGSKSVRAPFVLNATYASVNQVLDKVEGSSNIAPFKIKYELCEIILCDVGNDLRGVGLTVMDGPFFSIMPFGKTGYHSLTSVTFTPHVTSYDSLPSFSCQSGTGCAAWQLANCNDCIHKPESAWPYMSHLAQKYMRDDYSFTYKSSLFSIKPILKSSEVDDSRPTAIRVNSAEPTLISVLSGKIDTVYDLDPYLDGTAEDMVSKIIQSN